MWAYPAFGCLQAAAGRRDSAALPEGLFLLGKSPSGRTVAAPGTATRQPVPPRGRARRGTRVPGAEPGAGLGSESAPPPRPRGRTSRLLRIKLFEASLLRSRERKMAAPAGGGGSAVSVLAPNGRRHTVKVTPSTVLLQVRPPARLGNGRTGGRAGGLGSPSRGPPLRLLPGLRGGTGPRGAGPGAANERPSRGGRPPRPLALLRSSWVPGAGRDAQRRRS